MDIRPLYIIGWFGAVFTTLIFSLVLLIFLSAERVVFPKNQNFKLYAAVPQNLSHASFTIEAADGRAKIIEDFFTKYGAVLSDYGQAFVNAADRNQLDWRLLPSIAMQESHGGKKVIKGSYNPFGFGIYGSMVVKFSSWEEAIEKVAKALREDYIDKGLKNPAQIMNKYTPLSAAKGGRWAKAVSSFMQELQ